MNEITQWLTVYLINSAWQIPVLALCTAGLLKLAARGGAKLQYRLWVGCLLLAIVLPAMPRVGMPSFRWHRAEPVSVAKDVDATPVARASDRIAIYTDAIVTPVEKKSGSRVLLWLYALSLLAGVGKLLWELLATCAVVKGARPVPLAPAAAEAMARSAEAFGIAPIAAYRSAELRSPATVSWPRPMLLVPEDFASVSGEDAAAAISHELAHILRRDFAANLFFETVSLAVFYHPAMHWMKRRIAESREVLCDEMAAAVTMDRTAYARSLVNLAESASVPHTEQNLSLGVLGTSTLEKRIMRLIDGRLPSSQGSRVLAAIGCWVALAGLCAGVMELNIRPSVVQAAGAAALAPLRSASPASLTFDVASVKVNRSGSRDMLWGCKGTDGKTLSEVKDHNLSLVGSGDIPTGGCVVRNTPLQWVIALAYQIPWDRENQVIKGGPDWVSAGLDSQERFDIDAKTEQPATRAQLLQMLQALLADRFQMKIHQEERELPVYELTIAKNAPRLTKAPADRDCSVIASPEVPCHDFSGGWDGLTGRSVSMEEFAARLSRYPGRVVVDKTGLDGLYDIKTGAFWMPFPGTPDPGTPTIFDMLQDQFGLKLKAAKDPVKVLVVDSAQQPSAN